MVDKVRKKNRGNEGPPGMYTVHCKGEVLAKRTVSRGIKGAL